MQNTYELLYIVPGQFTDEEISPIIEKIGGILTEVGATVRRHENLGRIKMAYQIKEVRNGSYILAYFSLDSSLVQEVDRRLRLTDEVLRHIVCIPSKGAEERVYEITGYIAPLTDEGRSARPGKRSSKKNNNSEEKKNDGSPEISADVIEKKVDDLIKEDVSLVV